MPDHERLMEVLDAALEAAPGDRGALLDTLCAGDGELRAEVEKLLALEDETGGFLIQPAVDLAAVVEGETAERVGPYRLLDTLGRGGMGTVYLAVREDDFEKQVAVKVLRREWAMGSAVRRFHAERQILARLEHPRIARLLDGGTLADGRPYLVMEYVDGMPVDCFCASRSFGVRQRLELFQQLCEAVAFAHRNLVVHRDLKPGNVLVTADGVPKLLDFGIAKLLDPTDAEQAALTLPTSRPMTLRYASPEQVLGDPVTTASDVYALGLLLFELLTLRLPSDLKDCPAGDVPRRIREDEPEPPSRWDAPGRRIHADVDAIVLKALRKDPAERYTSAEQLAADVERHLRGLPVHARRWTWLYALGKLVRRRPAAVTAAILFVVFSLTSTLFWHASVEERERTETERRFALRQQERAERVSSFLTDLFHSADPDAARGGGMTVREVLEAGRKRLAEGLEDDPELEAVLAGTLGDVYRNLGLYDEAVELLRRSVTLRRELYPEGDARLAVALNDLGSVLFYMERYPEAEELLRESLSWRRRLGEDPAAIARALNNLAAVLKPQGKLAEAGDLYREALEIREALYGPKHPNVGSTLYSLGTLHLDMGDPDGAEPLLRRALKIYVAAYGEKHTRVASVQNTLGKVLLAQGKLTEAENVLRRALSTRRELLGDGHEHVAATRQVLDDVMSAAR